MLKTADVVVDVVKVSRTPEKYVSNKMGQLNVNSENSFIINGNSRFFGTVAILTPAKLNGLKMFRPPIMMKSM